MQKKPKPLEIVHFGFDTDGLSGLMVFWSFFKVYLFQLTTYMFIIIWDLSLFKNCISS